MGVDAKAGAFEGFALLPKFLMCRLALVEGKPVLIRSHNVGVASPYKDTSRVSFSQFFLIHTGIPSIIVLYGRMAFTMIFEEY